MAQAKQQRINPAEHELTDAQNKVFKIVKRRQADGKTTTSGDVAKARGGKNRSYIYRLLAALMDKGLIEQYSRRYYRLTKQGE